MRGDYREGGAVPPPAWLGDVLKRNDTERMAIETWADVNNLGPVHVPPPMDFQDPAVLRRWQNGAPIPEELVPSFAAWLLHTKRRSEQISENQRRLRASTWAQWRLRDVGDYFEQFAEFHRREWGITEVCEDSAEREMQIQAVARNGQRRDVNRG